MNKKSFGLDIGATSLKLCWLDGKKGDYILKAASISPSGTKGIMSESPLDEEAMAQMIAKACKDAGVGAKLVNLALPENQVYTKVLEMPILSDKELASAI